MSFNFGEEDSRKKEYVAVRMESQLFRALKAEANNRGIDLSCCIRDLCKVFLENGIDNRPGTDALLSNNTLPGRDV